MVLVFFTALSLNLILIFSLGIKELVLRERTPVLHLYYPWIILFVSNLFLWVLLARIFFFLELSYILAFPLSALGSQGLEIVLFRFILEEKSEKNPGLFSVGSSYSGLAAAALFLTLRLANSFADAFLLSFAFSAGSLLAFLIIKEIQKRSFLEALPYGLRGIPIMLISMGLLSLIFSAASVLFLKVFL